MQRDTCGPEACRIHDEGQLLQMSTEDLAGIEQALKGSKRRRAVPGWSARREEWLLSLREAVHLKKGERGERGANVRRLMIDLLKEVRRKARPPVAWNVSQTVMLDKKNKKKGPASKRLIHLLDPVGKAFYKQVWKKRETKKWHFASGFMQTKEEGASYIASSGRDAQRQAGKQ